MAEKRKNPGKKVRWTLHSRHLAAARERAQVRREIRAMTPEQFLQSLVDAGIFTPGFRLTAPYRRLLKEGYVYAPKGMQPHMLPLLKQLSLKLQREARRSRRQEAASRAS
ncbi:hypothetical protein [Hyalangium rubrum]|uniref:Uncharacterized protein n=1 Tax=Hyalangium rubrum TaxID=3103134 RepID=A0ABU5H9G1_9BACT|nr:hypothetical protein [Hyalangium sp. s54d21]MDY7230121.1 hypothetical protein [Hyalangium sp. s54d21]